MFCTGTGTGTGSSNGFDYRFSDLLRDSSIAAHTIICALSGAGAGGSKPDTVLPKEPRVAFCIPGSCEYVCAQWGVWNAGGMTVPLHISHSPADIEYILKDSQSSLAMADSQHRELVEPIARRCGIPFVEMPRLMPAPHMCATASMSSLSTVSVDIPLSGRAQLIYTSGTTGKPKGVVSLHSTIAAQCQSLIQAWEINSADHLLHCLPLHHTHGIINALSTPLTAGARVSFLSKFDPSVVWNLFMKPPEPYTLWMAVPTMYSQLIKKYDDASPDQKKAMTDSCKQFRVMISGSSALPIPVLQRWAEISGHTLLERYGMTEIGMALSNPLRTDGVRTRRPGFVGTPLPLVKTKLKLGADSDSGSEATGGAAGNGKGTTSATEGFSSGELLIRGPTVFTEYWNRPDATKETFDADGWFKTGDIASIDLQTGEYRIDGRASVDILKTAGYKLSALEVESVLLTHPQIAECAVVGVPSIEFGQIVSAIITLKPSSAAATAAATATAASESEFREWCKSRLPSYGVPRKWLIVPSIPRNAMGKINKKQLVTLFDTTTKK